MRSIMTHSILLSIVRRSRGFIHGLSASFDVPVGCVQKPRNSVTARFMMTVVPAEGTAAHPSSSTLSPLGLDPENCTVAEIKHQLRRRGYTARKRTKAQLLGELRDLLRAESFAPSDPTVNIIINSKETADDETTAVATAGEQQQQQKQPERWSADAGWVNPADLERGPGGNALCRFCGQEIPSNRRTFCSNACVHEHKIRTQGSYVRKSVLYRDGGKCAECGVDADGLFRRAREAWAARDTPGERREAMAKEMVATPFEGKVPREGSTKKPTSGMFWHADHIVPVVRGGGQCSLNNYRTLCVPCHAEATKRLAAERAAERKKRKPESTNSSAAPSNLPAPMVASAEKASTTRKTVGVESCGQGCKNDTN